MERTTPRHIVAAGALVTDAAQRVLLIDSPWRGWEFPGGQIECGEDVITGLKREILEESGIHAKVGALAGLYSNLSNGVVIATFLADYLYGIPITSAESLQVIWCPREHCEARVTHPAVRARLRDMLDYDGRAVYRAYTLEPYRVVVEHRG
jgi:8-oxo-dGTP diphosphatase